ncbi:uncharacterized protein LOC117523433 [Thalassophryne amazonica]|uniref:uncharacterized protein LOC117523433 n=1 Tax=Thalassophryne amazonica TaxID=390379 RepID=UPI0014717FA6|nr:uncharacterized protein LOC117523433 [Thalassophryne amazonica]
MDLEVDVEGCTSADLKQKLDVVKSRLKDKRQDLYTLRDTSTSDVKMKPLEVRLLEKMTQNCQVFKKEISVVHLNRQMAYPRMLYKKSYNKERAQKKGLAIGSLSQLVTPQCPAVLMVVQESVRPDGHYGFTCQHREGSGLVVVRVEQTHLCVDDRLVEVNDVPVISSTEEELNDLLVQAPCAQIVVLRQPPPTFTSYGDPLLLPHGFDPDPIQSICPGMDVVTKETPPQRKVM